VDEKLEAEELSFATPAELRRWFAKHHARKRELILIYYKVGCGTPSVTWPQSVDEALCYGWIDGIRRNVDATRYSIRFTPRRVDSKWSAINLKRIEALREAGRMKAAGLAVHEARKDKHSTGYTYVRRDGQLTDEQLAKLRKNKKAWVFFEARAPSYKRLMAYWVNSAKQEETRERRFATLVADSGKGVRVASLAGTAKPKRK